MKILIDNFDGAGARDYTAAAAVAPPPVIRRALNRVAELRLALHLSDPALLVPAGGARVVVMPDDGTPLFTGYLGETLACDYLGWGERGPVYRLTFGAASDEALLDSQPLPDGLTFTGRTPADIVRILTAALLPGVFATTAVASLDPIAAFAADPQRTWSEHLADVARQARAAYRVLDHAVMLQPLGAQTHAFSESDAAFAPDALRLKVVPPGLNDAAVLGPSEPGAYIRDYFFDDPAAGVFTPSHTPFRQAEPVLLDESYTGTALDAARWSVADPSGALAVTGGSLTVDGGTGSDAETIVAFADQLELGGALVLEHGQVTFAGASDGILGGLYAGDVAAANCLAGFRVTTSSAQPAIRALINGVAVGASLATSAGHAYRLRTRLHSPEPFRLAQRYHSSTHPAGNPRSAGEAASALHGVLEVIDLDLAAGTAAAPQILWEGTLAAAPALAAYAVLSVAAMHAAITATRLWRAPDLELRVALPAEEPRTWLVGPADAGADAELNHTPEVRFFTAKAPPDQSRIELRYRSLARAAARVVNSAAAAELARGDDPGVRARWLAVTAPRPRTSADCACAAAVLLDDGAQPASSGEYVASRSLLAADVQPGDAVSFDLPSRAATYGGIVREVAIELRDLAGDESAYTLRFANDAALPSTAIAGSASAPPRGLLPLAYDAAAAFAPSLPDACVTTITQTSVIIDAGLLPPDGGGFEVRSFDAGWGTADGANLIGRFSAQQFIAPRRSRVAGYYLRAYDAASPRHYSRFSTALHIEFPL